MTGSGEAVAGKATGTGGGGAPSSGVPQAAAARAGAQQPMSRRAHTHPAARASSVVDEGCLQKGPRASSGA